MIKKIKENYDEISFIDLLKLIWNGKIKIVIITIIFFLVGFGYSSQIPQKYQNSLIVEQSTSLSLIKVKSLLRLIEDTDAKKFYLEENISSLNQYILKGLIEELKDYEEFTQIISEERQKFKKNLSNSYKKQKENLFEYSNLFELNNQNNYSSLILKLTWENYEEAKIIMDKTLKLAIKNFNDSFMSNVEEVVRSEKKIIINRDIATLDFLTEQSLIAKELDIQYNQIEAYPNISIENLNTFPYYLTGLKAINKQIDNIKNRKYSNFKVIENEINFIKNIDIEWVNYDIKLIDAKPLKNTKIILTISILSGLIFGVLYLLIFNALRSKD
jgi:LPS O-antigen subunit length determinant protein (WzzB/FepE family)